MIHARPSMTFGMTVCPYYECHNDVVGHRCDNPASTHSGVPEFMNDRRVASKTFHLFPRSTSPNLWIPLASEDTRGAVRRGSRDSSDSRAATTRDVKRVQVGRCGWTFTDFASITLDQGIVSQPLQVCHRIVHRLP